MISAKNTIFVYWLNYLPDQDLQNLVKGASCLALPSLSEGFGLPILEAFAAGVPVLTSSLTALPEVADKAAVLVGPYDIGAIAHGLEKILGDTIFANDLRERGIERARLFTWDRTAKQTIHLYKRFM
jgi:alpha-1,3-rhamnosyl/mannosyltransferase